jgi:mannose-1-phosphate guanylyltransferase
MYAVVMAGGSGTRFWPASTSERPKQFLPIASDRTMLEETIARVAPLVPEERVYVVVGERYVETTRAILGTSKARVLAEPFARNTAPCIGLAAIHAIRDGDEPMLVLPADHFVADATSFVRTLEQAAKIARDGALVTLGVPPTRPETGYGYVEVGERVEDAGEPAVHRVERFVEKPDAPTALAYLRSGRFRWNSGIFVFKPSTYLAETSVSLPELRAGLDRIASAIGTTDERRVLEEVFERSSSISVDYGVMERATAPIYMVDAAFGWSDVGSWEALYELRRDGADAEGNLANGPLAAVDARGNLVYTTTGRRVALLGVAGLVVAETEEAILVAPLDRSQEVKRFADAATWSPSGPEETA